jgi:chloramphenicol-sensitive protein RarD
MRENATAATTSETLPCGEAVEVVDASPPAAENARAGLLYGAGSYVWWGLSVFYFKALAGVAPLEILAHRVVWSVPVLFLWLAARGRFGDLLHAIRSRRTLLTLLASTALIGINWLLFITAVTTGRVLESSLGYYINPLVNVLLGIVFLGERLRPAQLASVALAAAGVVWLTVSYGSLPVLSLCLAGSFGLYGLLRKTVPADGPVGLTVETTLLFPLALGYLLFRQAHGELAFLHTRALTSSLLVLAGIVTTVPLVWFATAVRRLRLATMGFLQYLSPTLQLLIAVLAYGEPFTRTHAVTFACIWLALGIYSADALRRQR